MTNDPLWDRWDEVDPLLARALELPEPARSAFVEEACGDDRDLKTLLERLLALSSEERAETLAPGEHLLREAFELGREGDPGAPDPLIGARLGAYRVTGVLGEGGLGTVYLGEREDGLFERRVAIKTLRLALDTPGVVERFELERQILASLTHPAVAQMTDGGVTPDGRPYLVMEYVDGREIDRYADEQQLGIEDRIWLVLAVGEAVDYAHRHMVVHRDLKPSNILVTEDGSVKLLDFGVAKLLQPAGAGGSGTSALTRPEARFITPEYAAPEQIRAEQITTATDVHALGVLLFELLTGRRPFVAKQGSPFDVQRAVLEDAALSPSRAVTTGSVATTIGGRSAEDVARLRGTTVPHLRRVLSGDLAAILDKALRKRPEDRYGSVEELRADLRRYLTGFPVRAREGLRTYRAVKFVRRHWLPVSAAATFAVLLTGFSVALARTNREVGIQRDLARTEAENAGRVVDFLAAVLRGRDPTDAPSDTLSALQLVAWGVERVDAEFSDRPAVQAELLMVLANAMNNMGRFDESRELAARSVELRREVPGGERDLADALHRMAALHRVERSYYEARDASAESLRIRRSLGETSGPEMAEALVEYGDALSGLQEIDSAAAAIEEALQIRRENPDDEAGLTTTLLRLAPIRRAQGRLDEAEALYVQGIPRYRELPSAKGGDLSAHLNNLAYLRRLRGDFQGADSLYREGLAVSSEVYGAGHPNTLLVSANLAAALHDGGRADEVPEILRARITAAEAQWPDGHWRVAGTKQALGDHLLRIGAFEQSEPHLRAAAAEFEEALGPLHAWTSFSYARLAVLDLLQDDGSSGRPFLDRLHGWVDSLTTEAGGVVSLDHRNLINRFLTVLRDTGPESELARFEALLADGEG